MINKNSSRLRLELLSLELVKLLSLFRDDALDREKVFAIGFRLDLYYDAWLSPFDPLMRGLEGFD